MTWYDKRRQRLPLPCPASFSPAALAGALRGLPLLLAIAVSATLPGVSAKAQAPAAQQPADKVAPSEAGAPPAAAPNPALKSSAEPAGVLIVDDGAGSSEPLTGAHAAVQRYTEGGERKAHLAASSLAKAEEAIRNLAGKYPTVIVVGAGAGPVVERVAKTMPDKRFTLIGAGATGSNIRSVTFRDREIEWLGAWLAGRVAENGRIGFVGGPPSPARRIALCAAAQGLIAANRAAMLFPDLESNEPAPHPAQRGGVLARGQIDRGAEVVLTPAGATGIGAMEVVRDMGALGVAWTSASANLFPRNLLALQLRHYDQAIETELLSAANGQWSAGETSVGLAEAAIELRLNDAVAPPVSREVREALQGHAAAISTGALQVHDISTDQRCPTPVNGQGMSSAGR